VKIRPFRDEDAVAAAEVVRPLERAFTVTPQGLRHQERSMPERAHRQSWVALDDGDVVGFATVWFRWAAGPTAHPRIWVGVRPDRRRRGIGSALYELAEAHAVAHGARWLNTELDEDDDGIAFANARRFELSTTPSEVELIVVLDPQDADVSELEPLLDETRRQGFELVAIQGVVKRACGNEQPRIDFARERSTMTEHRHQRNKT
jgi:GNAT superfamily N-acetyltransferase